MREFPIVGNVKQNSLYEIQLEIVDDAGNVIAESGKSRLAFVSDGISMNEDIKNEPCVMEIKGINAQGISAIDGRKFSLRIKSLTLKNNNLSAEFVKSGQDATLTREAAIRLGYDWETIDMMFGSKNSITIKSSKEAVFTEKNLKDVASTAKVLAAFPTSALRNGFTGRISFGSDVKQNEYSFRGAYNSKLSLLDVMENSVEAGKKIAENVKAIRALEYDVYSDGKNVFIYAKEKININQEPTSKAWSNQRYAMNLASIEEGLAPVYSQNGEKDPNKWKIVDDSFDNLEENKTADGYRVLSDDEKSLLSKAKIIIEGGSIAVARSVAGADKDKVIAEFNAKQAAKKAAEAAEAAARHERIQAAFAGIMKPFRDKFLPAPKDYKAQFQGVKGSFKMEIPFVGEVERKIDIKVSAIEVTQGLWEQIMGTNPSIGVKDELYPVNNISYYEAIVFCNKLSEAAGLTPVYTLKKSADVSTWGAIPTSDNKDWNKISVNKKADGFRLPSTEEIAAYTNRPGYSSYYVGCAESDDSVEIEGEDIAKPTEAERDKFSLYNTNDGVYEMYSDKKGAGYVSGKNFTAFGNAGKDGKVGLRLVCGK